MPLPYIRVISSVTLLVMWLTFSVIEVGSIDKVIIGIVPMSQILNL